MISLKNTLEAIKNKISSHETSIDTLEDSQVYSTTEKVVGEWIDGKPIYRKVITGTSVSDSVNHGISSLDWLVNATISTHLSHDGRYRMMNFVYNNKGSSNSAWYGGFVISTTTIVFECGTSFVQSVDKWVAVLEYTKTTD